MLKKYDGTNWNTVSYGKYFSGTEQFTNFPVFIRSIDQSVQAYTIKGNTSASGTPSPSSPITIEGVGVKTANLFDISTIRTGIYLAQTGAYYSSGGKCSQKMSAKPNTSYTLSLISENNINVRILRWNGSTYITNNAQYSVHGYITFTVTTSADTDTIAFNIEGDNAEYATDIMFNEGSALPYEPYGKYKISISKDLSQLTPMYLTQQLFKVGDYSDNVNSSNTANYKIKKLVLTGNETATSVTQTTDGNNYCIAYKYSDLGMTDILNYDKYTFECDYPIFLSTHFAMKSIAGATLPNEYNNISAGEMGGNTWKATAYDQPNTFNRYIIFCVAGITTLADFKAWLAAQYAVGTPVTLWYILATPTTESITAPSIPTTGGTATIDVDTTVKPSEMSLTYNGKHLNKSKKYNGNNWI